MAGSAAGSGGGKQQPAPSSIVKGLQTRTTQGNASKWGNKELKSWLKDRNITDRGCLEKEELVLRVSQSGFYSDECYICLNDYGQGEELRCLPCLHEFHTSCIDKWLGDVHRTCPLCREDICAEGKSSCVPDTKPPASG